MLIRVSKGVCQCLTPSEVVEIINSALPLPYYGVTHAKQWKITRDHQQSITMVHRDEPLGNYHRTFTVKLIEKLELEPE